VAQSIEAKQHGRPLQLIFSVGGGNREKNVSVNFVRSIEPPKRARRHCGVPLAVVGRRDGGTN
jgi:hypothetical protein